MSERIPDLVHEVRSDGLSGYFVVSVTGEQFPYVNFGADRTRSHHEATARWRKLEQILVHRQVYEPQPARIENHEGRFLHPVRDVEKIIALWKRGEPFTY